MKPLIGESFGHVREERRGCFPLNCLSCACCGCVPIQLRTVQDYTHLVLFVTILLVIASDVLVIVSWSTLKKKAFYTNNLVSSREFIVILITVLIVCWLIGTAKQFDQRIVDKRKKLVKQRVSLTKSHQNLIVALNGHLEKGLEVNTSLVESIFHGKIRSFQRWLENAKEKTIIFDGDLKDYEALLGNFRIFCLQWFTAFSECSVDPVDHPWRIPLTLADLESFDTVKGVAEYCLDCLEIALSDELIQHNKADCRRMLEANLEWHSGSGPGPAIDTRTLKTIFDEEKSMFGAVNTSCNCPTWIVFCDFDVACCSGNPYSADHWPRKLDLLLCGCLFKNADHVRLAMAWLLSWVLIGLHFWAFWKEKNDKETEGDGHTVKFILLESLTGLLAITLTLLLCGFEDLDFCCQLDQETTALRENIATITEKSKAVEQFWLEVEALTEVWVYRTIPRFEILERVTHALEDTPAQERHRLWTKVNDRLVELDDFLGPIAKWKGNGMTEQKNIFKNQIKYILTQEGLLNVMAGIQIICSNSSTHIVDLTNALKGIEHPNTDQRTKALHEAAGVWKKSETGVKNAAPPCVTSEEKKIKSGVETPAETAIVVKMLETVPSSTKVDPNGYLEIIS